MRSPILWCLVGLACAGCAGPKQDQATAVPVPKELLARSYSMQELGIEFVPGQEGRAIRWQEKISPRRAVTVALFKDENPMRAQPRVEARFNEGESVVLSLDSGAALNVLESGLALQNGAKVADPKMLGNVFQGLGGSRYAYYGIMDLLQIEELKISNWLTVLRPSSSEVQQSEMDNVIGMTTLAKFAYVTIDYPRNQAVFCGDQRYQPSGRIEAVAPITIEAFQPLIEVQVLESYSVMLLLDTGNDAVLMLPSSLIQDLALSDLAAVGKKGSYTGLGGAVETITFTIPRISLGGRTFHNVATTVVPDHFPPSLGSGFLQDFKATLDFRERKLWLEK